MHFSELVFLHAPALSLVPAGPPTPVLALRSRLGTLKPRVSFWNAYLVTSPLALIKNLHYLVIVFRMIKTEIFNLTHRVRPFICFGSYLTSHFSACLTSLPSPPLPSSFLLPPSFPSFPPFLFYKYHLLGICCFFSLFTYWFKTVAPRGSGTLVTWMCV